MKNLSRVAWLCVLALLISLFVATPASAAAPTGLRTLAVGYDHINYAGEQFEIYVNDRGDCDAAGYTKELPNSWKSRMSSIKIAPGSYCSMINVYRKTAWNTNSGQICYSGQLPVSNLAAYANCNDNIWGMTVYKGPRRG